MHKYESDSLISIVVPVYNISDCVEKCILSLLAQTYENIEIVLVDDGSTDESGDICDKYAKEDARVKVVHKKNGGLSDARNKGIEEAIGEYISLVDGDDFVDKDYIERQYKILEEYGADIAITSHRVIYPKKEINESTGEKYVDEPEEILRRILYDDGVNLSAWGKLYSAKLFKNIKYPKGRLFEDSATTYKLVDVCDKIAVDSIPTYNYVMRPNSIVNESFSTSKMDLITSTKEMTDYVRGKYPKLNKGCDRRMMYAYLSTLSQLAKSKTKDKASEQILMSYIKSNRKKVLKDKNLPKRDRWALRSTFFGFGFYRFAWGIYARMSGRA